MGAVELPPWAASGAGTKERVGNRAPIGPADYRSASGRPIRDEWNGSGVFGVGLRLTAGARRLRGCTSAPRGGKSRCRAAGATFPRLWRRDQAGPGAPAGGGGHGAPNKATLGGPSGPAPARHRSAPLPVTPPAAAAYGRGEGAQPGARAARRRGSVGAEGFPAAQARTADGRGGAAGGRRTCGTGSGGAGEPRLLPPVGDGRAGASRGPGRARRLEPAPEADSPLTHLPGR